MIYIDKEIPCFPNGKYRWTVVTHLFADSLEELHKFAKQIGLKKQWFQDHPKLKHYDLNHTRRLAAIAHGAKQLWGKELLDKWNELKQKQCNHL